MRSALAILTLGALLCTAGLAQAQTQEEQVFNISGATLLSSFFNTRAGINDFIDVDGDTNVTGAGFSDPLMYVPTPIPSGSFRAQDAQPGTPGQGSIWWIYQYRGHGSGNGLKELVEYWDGNNPAPSSYLDLTAGAAADGEAVVNTLSMAGPYSAGGNPPASDHVVYYGSNQTQTSDPMVHDGTSVRVDMSVMDVPTTWFVTVSGSGSWNKAPRNPNGNANAGYGDNPRISLPKIDHATGSAYIGNDGNPTVGNKLKSLTPKDPAKPTLNTNTGSPDVNTVFDTPVAYVPIGMVANPGVKFADRDGDGQGGDVKKTEMQHLFAAGRMPNGENLVAITRDSGSGTRNAAMNSLGVDPSWGVGENFGPKEKDNKANLLGPDYIPSNINSSSRMRDRITANRLAVGYNGFKGKAGPPSMDGRQELLNVMNDTSGGTAYVRPKMMRPSEVIGGNDANILYDGDITDVDASAEYGVYFQDTNGNGVFDANDWGTSGGNEGSVWAKDYDVNNIVHNDGVNTGHQIGGLETFATVGDPFAESIDYNGDGDTTDPGEAGNGHAFGMQNAAARDYLRNIIASIEAYEFLDPNSVDLALFGTPGQYMADNYALVAQVEHLHDAAAPGTFTTNQDLNTDLHNAQILPQIDLDPEYGGEPGNRLLIGGGGDSDGTHYGTVPERTEQASLPAGYTYTDTTSADAYVCLDGTTLSYGVLMEAGDAKYDRNGVTGDFDGDLDRDTDDIDDMVLAYKARHGVDGVGIGDLAGPDAGKLCPELMGDFNGDGRYDMADVRYGADGLFTSSPLNRKANFTAVDQADAASGGDGNFFGTVLAHGTYDAGDSRADIAGTDLDLDGDVDGWDNAGGWGPIGADGVVDDKDIDYVFYQFKKNPLLEAATGSKAFADGVADWSDLDEAVFFDLSADIDGDLDVDEDDVTELVEVILETEVGDASLDGVIDGTDLGLMAGAWGSTTAGWGTGDLNGDGVVDGTDLGLMAGNWGFSGTESPDVPEPVTLSLLGLGGLALLRRRRN
jgi:hypothetical protein